MKLNDYINLLPRESKKSALPAMNAGVIAAAGVALVWIGAYGWQVKTAWDLKQYLAEVTATKQSLTNELREVHRELGLSIPAGVTPERASVINSLLGERVLWSEVFRNFSRIVPQGLWFDNLEGSSGERAEIRIKGGALNYMTIADFMLAIEKSGYFEKPQLLYAQKAAVQGQDVIGFEIICGIRKGMSGR